MRSFREVPDRESKIEGLPFLRNYSTESRTMAADGSCHGSTSSQQG
jgi:hypothetical protein